MCRAEKVGHRFGEGKTERRHGRDTRAGRWATDQYSRARRGEPADGHRRPEPLPGSSGDGHLNRTSGRTEAQRDRTARPLQPPRGCPCAGVYDRGHRLVETDAHRCAGRNGQPAATGVRDGSAYAQPLAPFASDQPAKPTRSPNHNFDGHPLARGQRSFWCQPAVAHRERNRVPIRACCARTFERATKRLHVNPRERHAVRDKRRPGPQQRGRDHTEQRQRGNRRRSPDDAVASATSCRPDPHSHRGYGRTVKAGPWRASLGFS